MSYYAYEIVRNSFFLLSWGVWLTAMLSSCKCRKKYQEFLVRKQKCSGTFDLNQNQICEFGVGVYLMSEAKLPVLLYADLFSSIMVSMHP